MTLATLMENHRTAIEAIADCDTPHSDAAHSAERTAARAIVSYRVTSLEDVRAVAVYATGEELVVEDKAELFRSLAA